MRNTLLLSFVFIAACSHHVTGPTGGADTNPPPNTAPTGSSTSTTLPAGAKRAFVTSTQYYGSLSFAARSYAGEVGGAAAGDALCQQVAEAAELGGEWQAYLGDEEQDASLRLEGNGPWYAMNGTKLFNNKANLATKPLAAFTLDERGAAVESTDYREPVVAAWTGVAGSRCENWTSSSQTANPVVGLVGARDQSWRAASTHWRCSDRAHLYCFEK